MQNLILELYKTHRTVLTSKDIALLWRMQDLNNLKSKIAYYIKRGNLMRISIIRMIRMLSECPEKSEWESE